MADELLLLVQAWDEILPYQLESKRSHCERIYNRFTELCGGYTERTEQAMYLQRSVLSYNFKLIRDYEKERKRNGMPGDWFALSPQGRAQVFCNKESRSYRFVDLGQDMFNAIDRIKKRAPLASPPQPHAHKPRVPAKQKATQAVKKIWADDEDNSRLIAHEWSHDELLNLVHAWRDEVRDCHSNLGSKLVAKVMNKRIYERFTVLCNGVTTRTAAAVATKKRDLTQSYHFIAKINAQQRKHHQRMWFTMPKIEKLAIFQGVGRTTHLSDMPEDIFLRIEKVLGEERSLGVRGKRRADEIEYDDAFEEEEDDEPDSKPSPSLRVQAAPQRAPNKKQKRKSAAEHQGAGAEREVPAKKRPDVKSLGALLAELRQIAVAQEGQARCMKEIVREIKDANRVGNGSATTLRALKDPPKVVIRARSASCARGSQNEAREVQNAAGDNFQARGQKRPARDRASKVKNDPCSTRSLVQETILRLQNQGGTGPAWFE